MLLVVPLMRTTGRGMAAWWWKVVMVMVLLLWETGRAWFGARLGIREELGLGTGVDTVCFGLLGGFKAGL